MPEFNYYHPIEVRYGDLDPQGHLNNAKYLTYMEQARVSYVKHLGLWNSTSFLDVGIILADIHITFHAAVQFGQPVRVGVCVSRLGNKSMDMHYIIEDTRSGEELASGSSVVVTYDYHKNLAIPIPDEWRRVISAFDKIQARDKA